MKFSFTEEPLTFGIEGVEIGVPVINIGQPNYIMIRTPSPTFGADSLLCIPINHHGELHLLSTLRWTSKFKLAPAGSVIKIVL